MRALYEIDQDILDCVDLETGEILDTEKLDALQMDTWKKVIQEMQNALSVLGVSKYAG